MEEQDTQKTSFWKRFRENKLAFASLIFLGVLVFVSIFSSYLRWDTSTDVMIQIPSFEKSKPLTRAQLLKVRKNMEVEESSFFERLGLGGKELAYDFYVCYDYTENRDSIFIQTDTLDQTYTGIAKLNVVYPLNEEQGYSFKEGMFTGTLIDGEQLVVSQKELDEEVHSLIGTHTFFLGTDNNGRDLWSMLVAGVPVSISIGLVSMLISIVLGTVLGALAGYYGGLLDKAVMWVVNVTWAIPALLLVIAFSLAFGGGILMVFVAVGLTMWVEVARMVRAEVMSIKERPFIQANVAMGYSNRRILWKHIIPNLVASLMVVASANFATAILVEAGLSYLGLGVQAPTPSWGSMIREYQGYISTDDAYLTLVPGLAITLTVLAIMLISNGLRDAFDIKRGSRLLF